MKTTPFKKTTFEADSNMIIAAELQSGMIVRLANNKYFYVDDIDIEFNEDKYSDTYTDQQLYADDFHPEHYKVTLYDEWENEISGIPGNYLVSAFVKLPGIWTPTDRQPKKLTPYQEAIIASGGKISFAYNHSSKDASAQTSSMPLIINEEEEADIWFEKNSERYIEKMLKLYDVDPIAQNFMLYIIKHKKIPLARLMDWCVDGNTTFLAEFTIGDNILG